MSYQISLKLEDVAGALARVMSSLRKLGLSPLEQSFEVLASGGRKLILEVDGPVLEADQLRSHFEGVRGVAGLLEGDGDTVAAAPAPSKPDTSDNPQAKVETRYKSKDSEAGDADIRDRMLIFSLLSRYPNVSARLVEIGSSIPEEERVQRMLDLGQGFGKHLYKNLKVKGEVSDLRSAIEMLLVPGLSPLVQIAQSSEGVRVSGFTKNMKHAAKKPESCQFVEGTLQGLLDSAESLQPHRVEKLQCLHGDAVACEYRITPI